MKISKIEKQKKDQSRYNIFLDGDFSFGLYDETLLKFGLRTGDDLDDKQIEEIKEFDDFNFGKKTAYSFLSYKQRSKKDIVKKLKSKKLSESVIDKVTALLEEQKYIDDSTYAKNYLESKLRTKPAGKRMLQNKLFEKGIDKETAEKILIENYSEEKQIESAKRIYRKYLKTLKGSTPGKKQKSYRYLASRGFDYDIINAVMKLEE